MTTRKSPLTQPDETFDVDFEPLLEYDGKDLQRELDAYDADLLAEFIQTDHRVTFSQLACETNSLSITSNGGVQLGSSDFHGVKDGSISMVECECGREFASKEEGRRHLEVVAHLRESELVLGDRDPLQFQAEQTDIRPGVPDHTNEALPASFEGVEVPVLVNESCWVGTDSIGPNLIAKPDSERTDGGGEGMESVVTEYINAYARRVLPLPENYQFLEWTLERMNDNSDGEPDVNSDTVYYSQVEQGSVMGWEFRPRIVEAALRSLTGGGEYDVETYTLYDCGPVPAVLEGSEEALLIAPGRAAASSSW